jgi:hypothetical protein
MYDACGMPQAGYASTVCCPYGLIDYDGEKYCAEMPYGAACYDSLMCGANMYCSKDGYCDFLSE